MKKINCLICKSTTYNYLFKSKQTKYYQCKNCSVVFTPVVENNEYIDWHRSEGYLKLENYLKNVYARIVRDVTYYKKKGLVLEIGSSLGFMLDCFRDKGFKVMGIEPSKYAANFSRKKGHIVKQGYFEYISIKDNSVDVVVMNHVLEHIKKPNKFLKRVHTILKKKGIVIICLPNFDSIEAQVFRQNWRFLMPEEHYLQFTPKTLSSLLMQNKFTVLSVKTTGSLTEFADLKQELWRCCKEDWKRLIYYILELIPAGIQHLLGRSSAIQIIAQKTN